MGPRTHSLTHSFTHPFTHSLTHSHTHEFTHPLTYSFTHTLTHSSIYSLTHSFIHAFIHWFIYSLTNQLTQSLTHSLITFLYNGERQKCSNYYIWEERQSEESLKTILSLQKNSICIVCAVWVHWTEGQDRLDSPTIYSKSYISHKSTCWF